MNLVGSSSSAESADEIVFDPSDAYLVVAATRDELDALASAINESLEMLDEREFQSRVGATRDDMIELSERIGAILHRAG